MIQNCSYCGAELEFAPDQELMVCEYCHHENRAKAEDTSDVDKLLDASIKRNAGCFDEAEKLYHELSVEKVGNYQAIWGRLLCKYGVVYIERENEERVLTCNRALDTEFKSEMAYKQVCQLAPAGEIAQFQKDADLISSIQRGIRQLKDTQYDIFICYKETEAGHTTTDSYEANDLYVRLAREGYKVFFAKESLKNKAGADYEAEIYNAIDKCRVMLVMGSKEEYFYSTWVKSEWTRYLAKCEDNSEKVLIPLVKVRYNILDFDNLPSKIQRQGIDYGKDFRNDYSRLRLRLRNIFSKTDPIFYQEDLEPDAIAREAIIMIADGEVEEGMKMLRSRAKKKSMEAWYLLGTVLYENQEDKEKLEEAFSWFKKAADAGYADARFQTGFMYELGIGTYSSREKAELYYRELDKDRYPIPDLSDI